MLPPSRVSSLLRRWPASTAKRLAAKALTSSVQPASTNVVSRHYSVQLRNRPPHNAWTPSRVANASSVQTAWFSSSAAPLDVPVPEMGDSISEGTVVEWLKQPGEAVAADDVVVVLETDKVSVDVRTPYAGTLGEHLAKVDDNVLVGKPLFQVIPAEGDAPAAPAAAPKEAVPVAAEEKAPPAASPNTSCSTVAAGEGVIVRVPEMGDSISEGTIVQWHKGVGDAVKADDVVLVIETDKVSVDVRTPAPGVIQELLAQENQIVLIDAPLFKLAPVGTVVQAPPPLPRRASNVPKHTEPNRPAPKNTPEPKAPVKAEADAAAAPVFFPFNRSEHREKMSRMRLRTAERLKQSQNTAASLTTFQEVDMTNLMTLRKTYKDAFEERHGVKLGFMSAFVKASAAALREIPSANARIDEATQEIVYYDFVDMSVAVATPKGLVTPVLRNTESMSFADVEKALAVVAEKARKGQLAIEDMAGGNFTISNGGVFGSLMGTPIINVPQSSILGMHATKMRPVVRNGQIEARAMMYLALTYDHRLIDGREAVTCLKSIADKIESPERLLLDL